MAARYLLRHAHDAFWRNAFREAMRVGLIEDGRYSSPTDEDVFLMYCMGGELC